MIHLNSRKTSLFKLANRSASFFVFLIISEFAGVLLAGLLVLLANFAILLADAIFQSQFKRLINKLSFNLQSELK